MFVVNMKLNLRKILIVLIIVILIILTILKFGSTSRINILNTSNTSNLSNYDYTLTDENFLSTLKQIHENIDSNLGKTIKISGFVFRMPDFKDGYFVCGRNTIVNSEDIVAGFLCQSDQESTLLDNEWIEMTGVIIKGEYNDAMPIIKVGNIKKIVAPANTFVKSSN